MSKQAELKTMKKTGRRPAAGRILPAAAALLHAAAVIGIVLLAEGTGLIAIGEHFSALRAFQQAHGISSN